MSNFRVKSLRLFEAATFEDQFRRPFQTHITEESMAQLRAGTHHGKELDPATLGRMASNFIQPSAKHEILLPINDGWGHKRCRFILELEISQYQGSGVRAIISGWTDHLGITPQGNVAPEMRFYTNNVISLRDTIRSGRQHTAIQSNDQVLYDTAMEQHDVYTSMQRSEQDYAMRPEDVYRHGTGAGELSHYADDNVVAINDMAGFNGGIKLNSRRNNHAGHYASSIMKSYKDATNDIDILEADYGDVNTMAGRSLGGSTIYDNHFMYALSRVCSIANTGYFEYADLMEIYDARELDRVTNINFLDNKSNVVHGYAGMSANWNDTTILTATAVNVMASVPGLMFECLLNSIEFRLFNNTLDGQPRLEIVNEYRIGSLVEGMHPKDLVERFFSRFMNEYVGGITANNNLEVDIRVHCDNLNTTVIDVSVNGHPHEQYRSPTFCDSLLTPVVTRNAALLDKIYQDFSMLNSWLGADDDYPRHKPMRPSQEPARLQHSQAPSRTPSKPNSLW